MKGVGAGYLAEGKVRITSRLELCRIDRNPSADCY